MHKAKSATNFTICIVQSLLHPLPTSFPSVSRVVFPTARLTAGKILLSDRSIEQAHLLCVSPPQHYHLSIDLHVPFAANGGLRPSYKKNPVTCASSKQRVMLQPFSALPIPVFYRFPNGVDEVPVIIECRLSRVVAQVKASDSCIPGDDRRAQTKDASTNRNPSAIKEGVLCRTERLDDV
ncbi:unnamed protein product [Prunus brigantina]